MALDVIFLLNGSESSVTNFEKHKERFPHAKKFVTQLTGIQAYKAASKLSNTSSFYLVDHDAVVDSEFDFSFTTNEHDKTYVHSWRYLLDETTFVDIGIFLFSKQMLRSQESDLAKIGSGIKYIEVSKPSIPMIEKTSIIFLSYDEPNAEANWLALQKRFPCAMRVHKVDGILAAHIACAKLSRTNNFYVVDGDSEILNTFDFSFETSDFDLEHYVHIWKCRNPANGLEYGYGGVKLFHKSMFDSFDEAMVDMSTLLGGGVKLIDEVASITHFNSDEFHAFRGAFREATKLASGIIKNQNDEESAKRLDTWCSVASGDFSEYVLGGANLGKEYGITNSQNIEKLQLVNRFSELYELFRKFKMNKKEKELLYTKYNKVDTKTIVSLTNLLYADFGITLEQFRDCLSFNELLSKFWLIDEVNKLGLNDKLNALIIDGEYGILANLLFQFSKTGIVKITSTDTNPKYEQIADTLNIDNVIDEWRFKAVTANPHSLNYERTECLFRGEDGPVKVHIDWNILIAPHCEKMYDLRGWSQKIPPEKLVVAQMNNYGHKTEVQAGFAEFKQNLAFSKVLFEGILPCEVYDRYMVIGIK